MNEDTVWADCIRFAIEHEVPWPRDPLAAPAPGEQPFGVHHGDPPPYNRLRGPLQPRGGVAGIVLHHGRELASWGDADRADQTFSVAKTYLAMLAGVAQARGLLPDIEARVADRLPGIGFDDEHNRQVTWKQLLQQTSEWQGECFGLPDQVDRWRKVSHDPRPAGGPKGGPRPLQPPGSYWEYNDVRINQLALALAHLFAAPLPEVFDEALMRPLGASTGWQWQGYDDAWFELNGRRVQSVPGGTHWGGGVSISARDQARLGQLLLDGGRHRGRALLPEAWVRWLREPCAIAPFYGGLVWLNRDGLSFPGASREAFVMAGAGGHFTWIEPALHAVVVVRWLDSAQAPGFMQRATQALTAGA